MLSVGAGPPSLQEVFLTPLAKELPTMPLYFSDAAGEAAKKEQHQKDTAPLRVSILQRYVTAKVWQTAKSKPATVIHTVLGTKFSGILGTYGWRQRFPPNGTEPESVTGFLKIPKDQVGMALQLSGRSGIFLEQLTRNATRPAVESGLPAACLTYSRRD